MNVTQHVDQLLSLVFASQCVSCQSPIEPDEFTGSNARQFGTRDWCDDCWRNLPGIDRGCCQVCGALSQHPALPRIPCGPCRGLKFRFRQTVAIGDYEGLLKQLVLDSKNRKDEPLSLQLGKLLGWRLERFDFLTSIDFMIPVATPWQRRLKRGFHGAAVIAEGVQAVTAIPIHSGVVGCTRSTGKQGMLSPSQRRANVRDAFAVRPLVNVNRANVLVIDDVMTSGATMNEVARVLMEAGAANVYGGVLARGTHSR